MLLRKQKKRILVADDDSDFLGVTRAVLEFAGFAVDTAENGEKALRQIKKCKYDLLILDVVMPRIDGIRLFEMARKSKRYAEVPVLFISGHWSKEGLEEDKRKIVDKADGFIQKPFRTKVFLETVKTLLGK